MGMAITIGVFTGAFSFGLFTGVRGAITNDPKLSMLAALLCGICAFGVASAFALVK